MADVTAAINALYGDRRMIVCIMTIPLYVTEYSNPVSKQLPARFSTSITIDDGFGQNKSREKYFLVIR